MHKSFSVALITPRPQYRCETHNYVTFVHLSNLFTNVPIPIPQVSSSGVPTTGYGR